MVCKVGLSRNSWPTQPSLWASCAMFVAVAGLISDANAQTPDAAIKRVLDDWDRRQRSFKSIRANLDGECVYPRGAISEFSLGREANGKVFPPVSFRCKLMASLLLDYAGNRHSMDYEREESLYNQDKNTATKSSKKFGVRFDGKRLGGMNPIDLDQRGEPVLTYYTGDFRRSQFDSPLVPFFVAMGTVPIHPDDRIRPGNYRVPYDAEFFCIHGRGTIDGRACVVIRSRKAGRSNLIYECWADSARNHLILRYLTFMSDKPFSSASIEYQTVNGVALPKKWEETIYMPGSNSVLYIATVQCSDIEADVSTPNKEFRFEEKPGRLIKRVDLQPLEAIADRRVKPTMASTTYAQVDSGGTPRSVTVEDGVPRRTLSSYFNAINIVSAALAALVFVGLLAIALQRRRRNWQRSTSIGVGG